VKPPNEEVPTVLEGLIADRNGSGAQVASGPISELSPVTLPENVRTSAIAGVPAATKAASPAAQANLRIFSLPSGADRIAPASGKGWRSREIRP
jgi:hypothetical protein